MQPFWKHPFVLIYSQATTPIEILASSHDVCSSSHVKRLMTWTRQANEGKVLMCTPLCFSNCGGKSSLPIHTLLLQSKPGIYYMAHGIKGSVIIHVFIHFFIYSFILKYLLSTYYVPESVLGIRVRAKKKHVRSLPSWNLCEKQSVCMHVCMYVSIYFK